jgi:hypothetical protein
MPEAPQPEERELLGQARAAGEKPTGELIRDLATETSLLVRQEVELAKAEIAEKARHAGIGIGGLGAAGFLGVFALATATVAAIAGLSLAVPVWAAALIVTAAYAAGAAAAGMLGARQLRRSTPPVPEQTVETVKEDVEWARTRIRSARR